MSLVLSCYILCVASAKYVVVNDGSKEQDSTDRSMMDDLLRPYVSGLERMLVALQPVIVSLCVLFEPCYITSLRQIFCGKHVLADR
jgi:hypothetical protein